MVRTPPLAYHDPRFIDSDEGRPVRIVSEYLAPLRAFSVAGVTATVVFFGSARARAGGVLGRYVDEATELARLRDRVERRAPGAASYRVLRRRPRDHGSRQPRRRRSPADAAWA